tara:strand:- start:38 stop:316 length:279 start_codon:yes stop_codon:yes gene_type:complete
MPNTKRDTTKRTRDKSIGYWIFGLIGIAIVLLIIGRMTSDSIQDNPEVNIESQTIELNSDTGSTEILENELENVTGSTIPDLETTKTEEADL